MEFDKLIFLKIEKKYFGSLELSLRSETGILRQLKNNNLFETLKKKFIALLIY